MNLRQIIEKTKEYPIFVRGTCVEEAIWLLGAKRDEYKSFPETIHAFPIYEGFTKANISPIKPIPENYTLDKMRDETLGFVDPNKCSFWINGNYENKEEFMKDTHRLGVRIYFSSRIISSLKYQQDCDVDDRPDQLCAVKIPLQINFDPNNIFAVEPLGITDSLLLNQALKCKDKILTPLFRNWDNLLGYICRNKLTGGKDGFNFP